MTGTTSGSAIVAPPANLAHAAQDRGPCTVDTIAQRLRDELGERRFRMWFERSARMELTRDGQGTLRIVVPNQFVRDWILHHFAQSLHAAVAHALGPQGRHEVVVESGPDESPPAPPEPSAAPPREIPGPRPVSPRLRYRLEDFIVGPSNEYAYASALRLVSEPGDAAAAPGPLFIHGGCGLGKTHLLQGVCEHLRHRDRKANVLYTTAEQFTNRFLDAIRSGKIEAFRKQIRRLDLLAVDDVHFLASKNATQQEFLHSFDAIDLSGSRIAMAGDQHPRHIPQFSQALASRCAGGMVVEIQTPDHPTRLRLIQAIAVRRGLRLMDSVAQVLAGQCLGSVRDLEGLMLRLEALATLETDSPTGGEPRLIGHTLLHRLIESEQLSTPRRIVRFEPLTELVCEELSVDRVSLRGKGRAAMTVLARAMISRLARRLTSMSYPEIAASLGRPNHSTIITAVQRVERQIASGQSVTLPSGRCVSLAELAQQLEHRALRSPAV